MPCSFPDCLSGLNNSAHYSVREVRSIYRSTLHSRFKDPVKVNYTLYPIPEQKRPGKLHKKLGAQGRPTSE